MAKYNYSKAGLKGLTPFPFLGEVKERTKHIEAASEELPKSVYNPNILAKKLHPEVQHVVVSEVKELKDAKSFKLVPDIETATKEMAYFRAGQYVAVALNVDGATVNKPYTICSGPKDALDNSYTLTVKITNPAYASGYILNNWKVGTKLDISGPQGEFYYQGLRDKKDVIAIAGGSGITPFYSMASAIADGIEDFNLTILYGSKDEENILLKDELKEIEQASKGKVKVVHILSDEKKEGYEYGFITAELVKKYAPESEYSVFVCGSKPMYRFISKEIEKLNLPKRLVRFELSGEVKDVEKYEDYPKDAAGKTFKMNVHIRGEVKELSCKSNETILWALEKAGIKAPSHCRSGECGFCHSRLISGTYYCPKEVDGRRAGDKKFNWIHPCCSFPTSDIEIEVFPLLG